MENQKRKCVVVGTLVFLIVATLVGVLCGIFIPKLIHSTRNKPPVIVHTGNATGPTGPGAERKKIVRVLINMHSDNWGDRRFRQIIYFFKAKAASGRRCVSNAISVPIVTMQAQIIRCSRVT